MEIFSSLLIVFQLFIKIVELAWNEQFSFLSYSCFIHVHDVNWKWIKKISREHLQISVVKFLALSEKVREPCEWASLRKLVLRVTLDKRKNNLKKLIALKEYVSYDWMMSLIVQDTWGYHAILSTRNRLFVEKEGIPYVIYTV
jgi:hypothetical protein